ncbi:hypothetical protein JCM10908_005831 [Rhodotorula pacifica]|uniref:uncharacterized protein n=1 Tax=Rhodotorula pacifica TaxID=1495444 RepID=UPI003174C8F3
MQAQQQRSASHGRRRSTSGGGGGGASGPYQPPTDTSPDLYDFANAFWTDGQSSRNNRGRDPDDVELDWGRNGYETVMGRVKAGNKVSDDMRALLKERASAADDYAKRLNKLSKHHFGSGETGHMERAMLQLKSELESSAKSQQDFAQLLRVQEGMLGDFSNKRDSARKTQQSSVEKLWKNIVNQRQHVLKAKAKYQDDAIQINALHAQASLLQGRDLDKATIKLDKAQQTVMVNERDYRNYVTVLKETTVNWNMAWKSFCDLVQDQEEERLEFLKSRMWDYANGLSTLAMNEDESAERTRTALEQVDPKTDVRIFVQQYGTGNAIPDPIPFVDVAAKEPPPKQTYKLARFTRSSTRIPGVKHSPSAIGDIAKAMGQAPAPIRQQSLPPSAEPVRSHSQPEPVTPVDAARPSSRAANRSSMPAYDEQPVRANGSPTKVTAEAARPPPAPQGEEGSFAPARFAVSPSANARARPTAESAAAASPSARPGHITAAAFQNRQVSPSPGSTAAAGGATSRYGDLSHAAGLPTNGTAPKPSADDEDENDPLVKALRVLQSTPVQASPRARSSVDLRNAAASPTQAQTRPQGHEAQHSFGSSRSRPASPEKPSMQVPTQGQPRARSPSIPPVQQQQQARPPSRAGSAVAANSPAAQPNRYSSSSAHLTSPPPAGQYSTRPASPSRGPGQSTSPQPFIPPSLRPSSPAIGANPALSSSPAAQSPGGAHPGPGYGTSPQQIAYASPPPPQTNVYGPPPPLQQQSPYGHPGVGQPPVAQPQQAAAAPYRAVSPAPRPASIVAPPVGYAPSPQQQQQQPHQYLSQAPSQQFQPQQQQVPPPQAAYQSPAPASYGGYPAAAQPQYQQPAYGRPASVVGAYPSPAAQQAALARTPSTHSGVSGVSVQQTPQQAYHLQQQPPQQQQLHQQQAPAQYHQQVQHAPAQQQQQLAQHPSQPQMPRAQSVASLRAGQAAPPPPTGQYTETGQPILFYVNALFDYAATSAEEFSFSTGDVIAVTGTDPDGWWQGNRVGDSGPSRLFPSK